MKTMKRALTLIMAIMMVAAMAACGNKPAASNGDETTGDGSLKRGQDAGKLIVACETSWPPFAYIDDKQQLVGYDVEVAAEIAKRLGVEIEYSSSNSWDGIVASLDSGRVDAIFNGVNIAGRVDKYGMTIPYMQNQLVLTVAADNEDIKSFEDLAGKTTANSLASTYMELAESYGATVQGIDTLEETIQLLTAGRIDATLNANVSFYDYLNVHPDADFKLVAQTEDASHVAIPIVKSEDSSFLDALNSAIDELRADGTLKELGEKYFGQDISSEN